MIRRRAAAPANHPGPFPDDFRHLGGKIRRGNVVDGLAVHNHRQPGVRADQDGNRAAVLQLVHQRQHLFRAEPAVEAEGIHPQPFQHRHCRRNIGAGQQPAPFVKDHRHKNRQGTALLDRQDRRFDLADVAHRLDDDAVGPSLRPGPDRLFKGADRCLKVQVPHRLEQFAGGADVQRHEDRPPGLISGLPRQFYPCRRQFRRLIVPAHFQPVGAKGVGGDKIGAGRDIVPVDLQDIFRMQQVPALRQLARPQPFFLQQRPHAAVKK